MLPGYAPKQIAYTYTSGWTPIQAAEHEMIVKDKSLSGVLQTQMQWRAKLRGHVHEIMSRKRKYPFNAEARRPWLPYAAFTLVDLPANRRN